MPGVKVPMSLIDNGRAREKAFARRKDSLTNKAKELPTLCGVEVAVVCAGPGGGAPAVWESKEGVVIQKYRSLPPEKRQVHTHQNYANGELGNKKTKLVKVRQGGPLALKHWSQALNKMTLEELLGSIDAALLATAERRKALGLPEIDDADGDQLQRIASDALAPFSGDSFDLEDMDGWGEELMWDGAAQPMATLSADQMQPSPGGVHYTNGGSSPRHQHLEYTNGSVGTGGNQYLQLQMPGNGNTNISQVAWDAFQPNAITVHPGYGHQFTDGNYVDMNCSQMQVPCNVNVQPNDWLSLCMWGADQSSSQAFAPGTCAYTPTEHCAPCTGDNFTGAPGIDMDGDFMDANGNGYETHCLADDLQCPYTSQDLGLHYLSDLADGVHF